MTINTWGEVETRFFSFGTVWRLKPLSVTVSQVYTFRGCFWGKTSRFSCPIRVTLLKAETQQRYIEALGTFGFFILLPTQHTDSSSACRWVCTIWGQQRHSIGPLIRHPCRMLLMNAAPRYLVGLLVSFANSGTDMHTRRWYIHQRLAGCIRYVPMTNGIRAFWSVFWKNPTWYLDRVYTYQTLTVPFIVAVISCAPLYWLTRPIVLRLSSLSRFLLIVTSSSGPRMYVIWTSPAYQACLFRNEEKQAKGEDSFCQHKWKYYEQLRGLFHKQFSPVGTRPSRWLHLHHEMRIGKK